MAKRMKYKIESKHPDCGEAIDRQLHNIALWCADEALNSGVMTDSRSFIALRVKRNWLDGKSTDRELNHAVRNAKDARYFRDSKARDAASVAYEAAKPELTPTRVRKIINRARMYTNWSISRDEMKEQLSIMGRPELLA